MVSVQNIDEGLVWGSVIYFDSTPVALYNGVNPMRKDSSVMEKQGLQ